MNFFNWLFNEFRGNVFNNLRLFIDWMARPFTNPLETVQNLWKPKVPSLARTIFLYLLLVVLIVGLGALTWLLGLDTIPTRGPRFFRLTWMGWVALLVYLIIRLGVAIMRQLRVLSPSYTRFADIDDAMQKGVRAAHEAGIAVDQVPLVLVTGLSGEAEKEFVKNQSVGTEVCVDDEELPIHWFGDENALWMTLPGVAASSLQAELLRKAQSELKLAGSRPAALAAQTPVAPALANASGQTISVGSFVAQGGDIEDPDAAMSTGVPVAPVAAKERKVAGDRMRYFCQALQSTRYPVCTVNAVILCVPFCDEVATEKVARQFRDCIGTDMTVLQEGLGVQCMSAVVFSGCNDNPAFRAYIERLPPQSLLHRCGISFPQLVELADSDPDRVFLWLQRDFELQAMQLFRSSAGLPINEDVFRFVDLVRRSQSYFTDILKSAFLQSAEPALSFGGVYFAELTPVGGVSHPFLGGVLAKILHEHDEVIAWTPETIEQDFRQKRSSRILLVVALLFIVVNVKLFWDLIMSRS